MLALLKNRLAELRAEAARGQQLLAQMDARRAELRDQLLRIDGAAKVIEELLAEPVEVPEPPPAPAETG